MKKIPFLVIIGLVATLTKTNSQSKIDKFCEVTLSLKNGFSTKLIATVSIGQVDSLFLFKDSSILSQLKKVNSLTTQVDVLNYMGSINWHLVTIVPYGTPSTQKIYFKREFDIQDIGK